MQALGTESFATQRDLESPSLAALPLPVKDQDYQYQNMLTRVIGSLHRFSCRFYQVFYFGYGGASILNDSSIHWAGECCTRCFLGVRKFAIRDCQLFMHLPELGGALFQHFIDTRM